MGGSMNSSSMNSLLPPSMNGLIPSTDGLLSASHDLPILASCTAVSIDTCTTLVRFIGHSWGHTPARVWRTHGFS